MEAIFLITSHENLRNRFHFKHLYFEENAFHPKKLRQLICLADFITLTDTKAFCSFSPTHELLSGLEEVTSESYENLKALPLFDITSFLPSLTIHI